MDRTDTTRADVPPDLDAVGVNASSERPFAAVLARRVSNALLTRAYRERPGEWDVHQDMAAGDVADVMPPAFVTVPSSFLTAITQPGSAMPNRLPSVTRNRVCWKVDCLPTSATNCLGMLSRDSGHRRVPEPPDRTTGWISMCNRQFV